ICEQMVQLLWEPNVVMRKVPPRLRLIKKEVFGGFQMSCLAFGFYPRHINLTLGDGTYQLRKSLEVSTEELKKRHDYTCTASHLSLDNKLDVSWESGAERVGLSILSALMVMVLIVILLGIFFCIKRRRRTTSQTLSQLGMKLLDCSQCHEKSFSIL
uniref:Immunoglobulin C1-set domain-containing protein n=1 Tax=Hucho hucho TaxID=62062 RepID=A0A4W5QGJ6_9TELE